MEEGIFSIDPSYGVITLNRKIRPPFNHTLLIVATDDGSCCGYVSSKSSMFRVGGLGDEGGIGVVRWVGLIWGGEKTKLWVCYDMMRCLRILRGEMGWRMLKRGEGGVECYAM